MFVFTGNGKNGLIREYEDLKVLNKEYQNLKDALDAVNIGTDIIPNWLPDGFSEDTISVNELSGINRIEVRAYYTNQESVITIAYSRIPDDTREGTSTFEKDDIAVEELEIGGITHYIFENLGVRTAVWSKENIECSISGDISDSDIKQMIYSIYEEGNQKSMREVKFRFITLTLILSIILALPAFATQNTSDRASEQLRSYFMDARNAGNGEIIITFSVDGTRKMEQIGAKKNRSI